MSEAYSAVDSAINELENIRKAVYKSNGNQVRNIDLIGMLKATAQTWFHLHRQTIFKHFKSLDASEIDSCYKNILAATTKFASKRTYTENIKLLKIHLIELRALVLTTEDKSNSPLTEDLAPDFSPLAGNQQMREILARRWNECIKCVNANAHLAAIVMMGGMLEALFVARANKMKDKSLLINASHAPKDKNTGKTADYQTWMLDSYIKVAHELKWIMRC